MTHDEAQAALYEIYRRTGYSASMTPKLSKRHQVATWRITYTLEECEYSVESNDPVQVITIALNHVKKELGE